MADYEKLKSDIASVIKNNGAGEITGAALQEQMLNIVDTLNEGKAEASKLTELEYEVSVFDYNQIKNTISRDKATKFFKDIRIYGENVPRLSLWLVRRSVANGYRIFLVEYDTLTTDNYVDYRSSTEENYIKVQVNDNVVVEMVVDWSVLEMEESIGDTDRLNRISSACYYKHIAAIENSLADISFLKEVSQKIVRIETFAASNSVANGILTEIGQIYYCDNPESGAYRQLRQATGGSKGAFTYTPYPLYKDGLYQCNNVLYFYNGIELVIADDEYISDQIIYGTSVFDINDITNKLFKLKTAKFFKDIRIYGENVPRLSVWNVRKTETEKRIFLVEYDTLTTDNYVDYRSSIEESYIKVQVNDKVVVEMVVDWDVLEMGEETGDTDRLNRIALSCYYPYSASLHLQVAELDKQVNGKPIVKVAYVGEEHSDIIARLSNGENGLCLTYRTNNVQALIEKTETGSVITRTGKDILLSYKYDIDGQMFEFNEMPEHSDWYLRFAECRNNKRKVTGISENVIELMTDVPNYSDETWDVTKHNGIYTIMQQSYAYLDNLVKEYSDCMTKYDPMASAAYEENGITIQPLSKVLSYMKKNGFSDYPIYAKGISAGTYTIGNYVDKQIKETPAYKTFVYKISNSFANKQDVGGVTYVKRILYVQAACHAPEWAGSIAACHLAKALLENSNGAKTLLSEFDVYIVPVLDGYSSIHGTYESALGVNINRNYPTAYWRAESADWGLAAGDQFATRLACGLIETLQPSVALDVHDYGINADSLGMVRACYTRTTSALMAAWQGTANAICNNADMQSKYFGAKKRNPRFPVFDAISNAATGRDYFFHKQIPCSALIELPSSINFTTTDNGYWSVTRREDTLYKADANAVAAMELINFAYMLCQYNLNEF